MFERFQMPMHIGDFLRKTRSLTPLQKNAYLHLMFEYWSNGSLPDDDAQLARIADMKPTQWRKERPTLERLFATGWRHEQLDAEIARVQQVAATNSARARKAELTRWGEETMTPNHYDRRSPSDIPN
jgi:uncharacterized protein YdaU (DUF1376 family)